MSFLTELTIPKREGRAVEVRQGQTLRIVAHEGKQVADLYAVGLRDYREKFSALLTAGMNGRSLSTVSRLYSSPPFYNSMFTITDDLYGIHWVGGRCSSAYYKLHRADELLPNCHTNIVEALKPYEISEYDVPLDTFNVFMNVEIHPDGRYGWTPPAIQAGDYIDLRADMDVLVAISACPNDEAVNDFDPKALQIKIYESGQVAGQFEGST